MASRNTQAAMAALKQDPNLMRELNRALTKVYEKAGVRAPLTQSEKVEVVASIAAALTPQGTIGTTVITGTQ